MGNKPDYNFSGQTNIYSGKVRDVYTVDNNLLVMVASDRISAFDVILPKQIPFKGQVLNQLAAHFLRATSNVAENWLIDVPHPRVSIGRRCESFAIEIIIRSCLVGSAWRAYKKGERTICGVTLPDGLQEYDKFDPIITPTTKVDEGHDEDTTYDEIVKQGLATKDELDEIYATATRLFAKGQQMAKDRGLLLADTKYEFGKYGGKILLIDEIHTPDSSRYFYADSYEAFLKNRKLATPEHLSKEFVRQWLIDNGFQGKQGQSVPDMSEEFINVISERYIKLYEEITGDKFQPAEQGKTQEDIKKLAEESITKWRSSTN